MAEDFPDFTRAVRLLGIDEAGDLVTVLVDSAGNLGAIVKGLAPGDVLTAVAVDAAGRIVMVPYGTTTVAGTATVTQSEKDREIQGAEGETLHTIAVDASGQMIMVPRGQSGAYMLVDGDGFLGARLLAHDPEDIVRWVHIDENGQLIMVPRGASGNYMSVDASGFLSALVKGIDGGAALRTIAVDTAGQIVMVPRGQSGNYMAIDANGYMTAVLKGAHDATLTTIGVDANGRIDAFLMDGSDQWGQQLRVGNADLVGRLGSPVTWDWRGNVLYMHDFSTGWGPCFSAVTGTGAAIAITPERGGYGGYAVKMTAGSDGTRLARVQLPIGVNPGSRVGVAARFSIYSNTGFVRLMLERWDSPSSPVGYVQIDVANKVIQVYDDTPTWQTLGSVPTSLGSFCYSWLKLVIDQDTGKYERVLYNDKYYDASAYTCSASGVAVEGVVAVSVSNYGRSGANDIVYLDQIVLTVNEPVNPAA